MNNEEFKARFISFYNLLISNEHLKIRIPEYQREYAQGRPNRKAENVRNLLIDDLHTALTENNKPTELDFVYGGTETDRNNSEEKYLVLIDGQQRLTMLFLLHWYVFAMANDKDAIKQLKKFSYATRESSKAFCEKLLEIEKLGIDDIKKYTVNTDDGTESKKANEYKDGPLAKYIKDQSWFKGSMQSDPTVCSMLVVLDCIHEKFKECVFSKVDKKLKDEECDCPIKFNLLDIENKLGGEKAVKQLYIKMNARGLPLTDFEIFKSSLQQSDLLLNYLTSSSSVTCSQENWELERKKTIGQINTDYTNLFFRIINNGDLSNGNGYDRAMMNFVNEVFRMNFFEALIQCGAGQKDYRSYNAPIMEMSGKEFADFTKTSGEKIWKEIKQIDDTNSGIVENSFNHSIKNIFDLFSALSIIFDNDNLDKDIKEYVQKLLKGLNENPFDSSLNGLSFPRILERSAIWPFLLKCEGNISHENIPINYEYWRSLVNRIILNGVWKSFEDICETMTGLRKIIRNCNITPKNSMVEFISNCTHRDNNGKVFSININFDDAEKKKLKIGNRAETQFDEEIIKAKLRLVDGDWENAIDNAEKRFADGQIWFLLDVAYSCDESEDSFENRYKTDNYSIDYFRKCYSAFDALFVKNESDVHSRTIKDDFKDYCFERALLASDNNNDFLLGMSSSSEKETKKFDKDFKIQLSHEAFLKDKQGPEYIRYNVMLNYFKNYVKSDSDNIKDFIDFVLGNVSSDLPEWKKVLMESCEVLTNKTKYNGLSNKTFENVFQPNLSYNDVNGDYTAVFTTANRRIKYSEIHLVALAAKLNNKGIQFVPMNYSDTDRTYLDDNGFPKTYFMIGNDKIAYYNGNFIKNDLDTKIGDSIKFALNNLTNEHKEKELVTV